MIHQHCSKLVRLRDFVPSKGSCLRQFGPEPTLRSCLRITFLFFFYFLEGPKVRSWYDQVPTTISGECACKIRHTPVIRSVWSIHLRERPRAAGHRPPTPSPIKRSFAAALLAGRLMPRASAGFFMCGCVLTHPSRWGGEQPINNIHYRIIMCQMRKINCILIVTLS